MFEANEEISRISGVEITSVALTLPVPPAWPLNLFPSLLENEEIQPKYWPVESNKKLGKHNKMV